MKVKLAPCLSKSHAMKLYQGLNGGEWSASCPSCFILGERAPDTHWIGG